MTHSDGDGSIRGPDSRSRRGLLKVLGGVLSTPFGIGATAYGLDRSYRDEDGDGIPDSLEGSAEFDAWLQEVFGVDQFEGFDPDRRDLLIDARYIGETSISDRTKNAVADLFRANGIHLQWLDYPERYDLGSFEGRYGYNARQILWSPWSFYHRTVERRLKNTAIQLIVVPGFGEGPHHRKLYSPWTESLEDDDGYVSGFNTGNRAVVTEQTNHETEAKLVLHEIAHYALCHSTDPANTGVMGSRDEFDLMAHEWDTLRSGLGAVRDTTGFDVAFRQCLWAGLTPSRFSLPAQLATGVDCDGCQVD